MEHHRKLISRNILQEETKGTVTKYFPQYSVEIKYSQILLTLKKLLDKQRQLLSRKNFKERQFFYTLLFFRQIKTLNNYKYSWAIWRIITGNHLLMLRPSTIYLHFNLTNFLKASKEFPFNWFAFDDFYTNSSTFVGNI